MNRTQLRKIVCTLLCVFILLGSLPLTGFAAEEAAAPVTASTHSHPICGSRCSCASDTHSSSTWNAWDGTTTLYSGYYYLTEDIVLDSTMILNYSYTTYLCLNGHSITCEDTVFDIYSYRSLLISDCVGTGKIESTDSWCTIGNSKYLSVWGGNILNSSGDSGLAAINAYPGTTTYVCGGRVEGTECTAIFSDPSSNIYIQGGTIHGGGSSAAIYGNGGSEGYGSLTISGGRITTGSSPWAISSVYVDRFSMTGGYVGGSIDIYSDQGTSTMSGGTINGTLSTGNKAIVTGGDLAADFAGDAEINAGTFRGSSYISGSNNTISGGDFTNCDILNISGKTWIYGGYFSTVHVGNAALYLSGIPDIETLEVTYPSVISAQNIDGTGSYGGDPIEIVLFYSYTSWKDGDIVIKNVKSDASAAKFVLSEDDSQWQYLERSGNDLVLRVMPHGTWGSVTWGIVDGVLTISGTGAINYASSGTKYPWYEYRNEFTEIVVESGITSVPDYAFEYLENVTSITLPETVTSLSLNAFNDCGSLNHLLLPSSLTSISGTSNTGSPAFIRCESLTDLYYLGTAEEWAALANANRVTSANSEMTIHFLVLFEPTVTCTSAGTAAYYRFDDTSVYGGMYSMDKEPISQPEFLPALGHRIVAEQTVEADPITVDNTASVPFLLTNGTYYSNNHSHSSSSDLRITAQYDCTLTLRYGVSSEKNYDKLTILHNSVSKAVASGSMTDQVLTLTLAAGDEVVVRYSKDGSVSSNSDQGWVSLEYDPVPGLGNVDVPAESFEPDCTNAVICDYCQAIVKEALGHLWDEGQVITPATEETEGEMLHTCGRCGETENVVIPVLEHVHSYNGTVTQPNCIENGYTTYTCRCGDSYEDDFVDALGHSYTNYKSNGDAACEADGTKTAQCDHGCGTKDTVTDTGSALGHSYTDYKSNGDAACEEDGTKTAQCDHGCGTKDTVTDTGSALGHSYTDYKSNGDAACEEDGTVTAECDHGCGTKDTKTDYGSALGHSYGDWVEVTAPDYLNDGQKIHTCHCGHSETDIIPATGPELVAAVGVLYLEDEQLIVLTDVPEDLTVLMSAYLNGQMVCTEIKVTPGSTTSFRLPDTDADTVQIFFLYRGWTPIGRQKTLSI